MFKFIKDMITSNNRYSLARAMLIVCFWVMIAYGIKALLVYGDVIPAGTTINTGTPPFLMEMFAALIVYVFANKTGLNKTGASDMLKFGEKTEDTKKEKKDETVVG